MSAIGIQLFETVRLRNYVYQLSSGEFFLSSVPGTAEFTAFGAEQWYSAGRGIIVG